MAKTKADARQHLSNRGVPLGQDYHRLNWDMKERIADAAKAHGYRKPKNANGSTARCFYEYCNR